MFGHKKPEVLVVGAGPVGLYTALALVQEGVRVRVVDKGPRAATRSYALALHPEALRLLEQVDALGEVLKSAYRVRRVAVCDQNGPRAEMRIAELAEDHSFLAVLPQDVLEGQLVDALAKRGVKVEWNHEVSQLTPHDDHADVTIDRMSLDTLGYTVQHSDWVVAKSKRYELPFVIGADGLSSVVRRRMEIDFEALGDSSDFEVFEFKTDAELGDQMLLVLGDDGISVCWPLPDGYCRWSFGIPKDEDAEDRRKDPNQIQIEVARDPARHEHRLRELLAQRAPWFKGNVDGIRWCMPVHFERRLAASFGRGRVWLVGDAGHVTGPAGIQSMNVGLREAAELAATVAGVLHGKVTADKLEDYASGRRAEWRGLLGADQLLEGGPDTDPWLLAHREQLVSCIPASGEDLFRLAEQLGFACHQPA